MKAIKVLFSNGNSINTNINGSEQEIVNYYCGQMFNLGYGEHDRMARALIVIFI